MGEGIGRGFEGKGEEGKRGDLNLLRRGLFDRLHLRGRGIEKGSSKER